MGQVIAGRFELVEPIAQGGQGVVWRARDLRRDAACAAKVLKQSDSAALLRFVREQGVQVGHPHLASPYGWAAEDHEVAIAMPLVAGGSLEGALADHGAFSEPLAADILLQVLDGVAALHAAGWVHRDVKPGNVLLEPTGLGGPHARLGDMGLAMRVDDPRLTALGSVQGTPGYLAPEVTADAGADPAQDLWAAGMTGLRLLRPDLVLTLPGAVDEALAGIESAALGAVLGRDGLLSAEPERRRAAAGGAAVALATLVAQKDDDGGYRTAAGEPFEVFDHAADPTAAEDDPDAGSASVGVAPDTTTPPVDAGGVETLAVSGPRTRRVDDEPTVETARPREAEEPTEPGRSQAEWVGIALLLLGGIALIAAAMLLSG